MRDAGRATWVACALLMSVGCVAAGEEPGIADESIIDGTRASIVDWPGAVIVAYNNAGLVQHCSGTLIAPRWVLTADHCRLGTRPDETQFELALDRIWVLTGRETMLQSQGEMLGVVEIVRPDPGATWDAALLRLSAPSTQPLVELATMEDMAALSTGMPGLLAGYGKTGTDILATRGGLMQVSLPLLMEGPADCTPPLMCAGGSGSGSACLGDSGGPLVVELRGRRVQVGITRSTASGGCRPPVELTRIDAVRDWIRRTLGAEADCIECDAALTGCLAGGTDRCTCEQRHDDCTRACGRREAPSHECCIDRCDDTNAACESSGADRCECEQARSSCEYLCGSTRPVSQTCCLAACGSEAQGCVDIGNPYCFCARGEAACRTSCGVPTSQPRWCRGVPDPEFPH